MSKPYSQACENNKNAILEILTTVLKDAHSVLEVGSGTGQHAVHFAKHLPHLVWQTADLKEHHSGINQWLDDENLHNTRAPLTLDVRHYDWQLAQYDAVFTANSLHIMSLASATHFIKNISQALHSGGQFIAYGPLNYDGAYTSESNARFDIWLNEQNEHSAIRDFEAINQFAKEGGLNLVQDYSMPANNRLLVWQKRVNTIA